MIYLVVQGLLILNVLIQFIIKGSSHVKLLKMLGYAKNDSFSSMFVLGSFYKYPTVILPFIERIDCDTEETKKQYQKVKKQSRILLLSLILSVLYFLCLWFIFGEEI